MYPNLGLVTYLVPPFLLGSWSEKSL